MPRTKSAQKQMRQARSRTARNRSQRSALRTALKQARSTAKSRSEAVKLLDRAARKRLIHPNKAARLKSHLAKAAK
ncbi:MAG TPA: 30S ribosomal protein S20 [Gemmatimonadales bacterium]|nr:30S ribosomal protein S20 [Gemmatimonadales bacterium]